MNAPSVSRVAARSVLHNASRRSRIARPLLDSTRQLSSTRSCRADDQDPFSPKRPSRTPDAAGKPQGDGTGQQGTSFDRVFAGLYGKPRSAAPPEAESAATSTEQPPPPAAPAASASKPGSTMESLSKSLLLQAFKSHQQNRPSLDTSALRNVELTGGSSSSFSSPSGFTSRHRNRQQPTEVQEDAIEPYHFHIYAHRRNTHVTVTRPNRNPIISMSCGNVGFRKAKRKAYDSAYQTVAYVLEKLYHAGWHEKINRLQVVLRGFGPGRDAAVKVLLSPEGKPLRHKIVSVADATRIKFGGTRSQNPRRV